jgi:hypothetical protein
MKLTSRVPSAPLRYYVGLQSKRRKLVMLFLFYPVLTCIGIIAYSFAPLTFFDASSGWSTIRPSNLLAIVGIGAVAIAIWVWSYMALMENWSWVTTAVAGALDERLVAQKNEVLARSFTILSLIVIVEFCLYGIRNTLNPYHSAQVAWLLFGLNVPLITSIPPAVIAWTEPDGIESEDVADSTFTTTAGA